MKVTRSVGGVIIGPRNQVAVVSQHGTSWSLVKGTVEPGEDDKTTALREFKEESGITNVQFVKKLGTYERYKMAENSSSEDTSVLKQITIYLCTTSEEELRPEDPDNPEAVWVDVDDVAGLLTHPKDKAFFNSVKGDVLTFIAERSRSQ